MHTRNLCVISLPFWFNWFHLFKGEIVSPANASSHQVIKMTICNETGTRCAGINGKGNLRVYDFGGS